MGVGDGDIEAICFHRSHQAANDADKDLKMNYGEVKAMTAANAELRELIALKLNQGCRVHAGLQTVIAFTSAIIIFKSLSASLAACMRTMKTIASMSPSPTPMFDIASVVWAG